MKVTIVGLLAAALLAPAVGGAAPAPSRLQVTAKEYVYVLSRHAVKAGPAIVELVNFGEDPHDLHMQRLGGGRVWKTPDVLPGDRYDLTVTLVKGRYRLWCAIADHRERGMTATLTVT